MLSCVCGDRLLWARQEQELTMRWVREHGGPSLAYQSEVENGKKDEVRSRMLDRWIQVLKVTEPFARGQLHRYADNPASCRGLAADVLSLIMSEPEPWTEVPAMVRARKTLSMIAQHSRQLPRVVLAYVLGVPLRVLDDMITGTLPVPQEVVRAIQDLTTLPGTFMESGELQAPSEATPILRLIYREVRKGRTLAELTEWIELADYGRAVRLARAKRISPDLLTRLVQRSDGSGS